MTISPVLSDTQGKLLVQHARKTVEQFLNTGKRITDADFEETFSFPSGVFVTLNRKGDLRGCIGYPTTEWPLAKALSEAAINAATQDPRFSPVTQDELDTITFEVTVLSVPQKIIVNDPKEYPSKVKVGQDGLIVKFESTSGLLLPQVATEYGWSASEFLDHTCIKAGLPKGFWLQGDVQILKFSGIVFKETEQE